MTVAHRPIIGFRVVGWRRLAADDLPRRPIVADHLPRRRLPADDLPRETRTPKMPASVELHGYRPQVPPGRP